MNEGKARRPMNAQELLTSTRSARKSLDTRAPVDLGDIRECLRMGLHAANGSNQQSWRWLLVTERQRRVAIARHYRDAYLSMTGGSFVANDLPEDSEFGRLISSTEWLVEHLEEVPLFVIPCYEPSITRMDGHDEFYSATLYGSIFPAVWNFQLALRTMGYGTCITTLHLHRQHEIRQLLSIPEQYIQGCLLPVGRLRSGAAMRPSPRRPLHEVTALNDWNGPSLGQG